MARIRKDRSKIAAEQSKAATYEKPVVKTLDRRDVVKAVNKGSKFPARGFAG